VLSPVKRELGNYAFIHVIYYNKLDHIRAGVTLNRRNGFSFSSPKSSHSFWRKQDFQ
jgi:hypothetical protein